MVSPSTAIAFNREGYSDDELKKLYLALLKPRTIEEKMLILLRQGKISKWFSGIGQEAVAVGAAMAMEKTDFILPLHRNLGVFTTRNTPLEKLFAQFQGKKSGFTKGRDRSFHFGSLPHHIVGMISHLGAQLSVACGIALAEKLDGNQAVTLAFSGDGATSEGEFHEAMNLAAVWDLPIIFVVENNGYGLSTPSSQQFRCEYLSDKAKGYGMESVKLEGNNILEMYDGIKKAREFVVGNSKPIFVEAMTFRMRGHEEASGNKYVPKLLLEEWATKDPIINFEQFLLTEKIISKELIDSSKEKFKLEINKALEVVFKESKAESCPEEELGEVYAPSSYKEIQPELSSTKTLRLIDAIRDGLDHSMEQFPELVLMGQDIADYGGVFKATESLMEKYGSTRVRNTPLCESAVVGAALGLAIKGKKAMMEMQFADFATCGFNQIINNLAKIHYRWGQAADVVVRMPTGASMGAGPFHSQSNEAWFFHTPGLKVVYPSTPSAAKGLLCASFSDPNPVLFFEHKTLYRSIEEEVPDGFYTSEIGKAKIAMKGTTLSIITYGLAVHWALELAEEVGDGLIEVIDLQTLLPWDKETVKASVMKTNKVLVCNEDCLTGSISGEIAAWIGENCFEYLDAPIMREGSLDTPIPFSTKLEDEFLPKQRIREKVRALLNY
ncbi:dehydrogenase E1 component subunit alpha/beta [Flammeovirgaceae bacterium SG7u.111]|nr:dehydrogenase E1 component subunit alpha/beta [Flammeovirgaceae bacterium SG7u.132]WPO38555.1 dehydrogenase E1 component subunit alpha/beta [Flammeovirgaceae bacterium SG7u.111]